jgi:hypothetical protein
MGYGPRDPAFGLYHNKVQTCHTISKEWCTFDIARTPIITKDTFENVDIQSEIRNLNRFRRKLDKKAYYIKKGIT